MNDTEIIKALECCKVARLKQDCLNLNCPFATEYGCNTNDEELRNVALDLIVRQSAEIERLRTVVEETETVYYAQIDKVRRVRKETIQEMIARLKGITDISYAAYGESAYRVFEHDLNVLLDEMEVEDV